jgi:copper chaperone CopZ
VVPSARIRYGETMRLILTSAIIFGFASTALAGQQTTVLHVENMMCGADPHIVHESLTRLKGVEHVEIALDAKTVIVSFDNAQVSVADLMTASGAAGYPATVGN